MRHIRLIGFVDEPTGNVGLIFKGTEGPEIFSAVDGGLLAHDLVEHQNGLGRIGCPEDELQAMGGLWHTRGRHGDMQQTYGSIWSPHQQLGWELLTIAEQTCGENSRWWPRLNRYRTHRHAYDDDFQEAIDHARKHIDKDMVSECFPWEAFFDNALHLMRIGYNKANRRFGSGYESNDLYREVRRAVEPYAKRAEEGQEFILAYGNGEARCWEIYPEY